MGDQNLHDHSKWISTCGPALSGLRDISHLQEAVLGIIISLSGVGVWGVYEYGRLGEMRLGS